MVYPFAEIEKKWQLYWEKNRTFCTPNDISRPKYYVLDMFPYPSGAGLHVGHPEGYTATDIIARYKRMQGFNVLHPMGWDAFGLPTERHAMETDIHPEIITKKNIDNFRKQLKSLGFSYDWDREINTTQASYYRWTQWIFLELFHSFYDEKKNKALPITDLPIPKSIIQDLKGKRDYINSKRLAYLTKAPVNWCAKLNTILANEEVEEWESKGYTVERRSMLQWMLRITAYAQRLLDDLKNVDWPKSTIELQKNWIGHSQGAEILFPVWGKKQATQQNIEAEGKAKGKAEGENEIRVFTTRPDTIYGVTYLVLAPEHDSVETLTGQSQKKEVNDYIEETKRQSERERIIKSEKETKTGVFTGSYACHPFTKEKIPIWIASYVLKSYGTGAIMAVPAHDERDFSFAQVFELPIATVVRPAINVKGRSQRQDIEKPTNAYTSYGVTIQSDFLTNLPTKRAIPKCIEEIEKRRIGKAQISYKLRDWLFSRQRYWGEPIPISHDNNGEYHPTPLAELPLKLPQIQEYKPAADGTSPLGTAKEWLYHSGPNGKELKREINTMPQWAGSCWYYLRFIDTNNNDAFFSPEKESYWMGKKGVDLYIGGAEHAVLHLLYARFWHKFLYDRGYVRQTEPFHRLVHQGIILGEDGNKMSKSLGNVVNPDVIIQKSGADSLRLFEMFLGPLEKSKPWSERGLGGINRFLMRVWRFYVLDEEPTEKKQIPDNNKTPEQKREIDPSLLKEPHAERKQKIESLIHSTIKKITEDIEKLSFNTAISCLMTFINKTHQEKHIGEKNAHIFVLLLSPFAPHLCEELWSLLGNSTSLAYATWPSYETKKITLDEIEVVFQVNGKVRGKSVVPVDISEEDLEKLALQNKGVQDFLRKNMKEVNRVIIVRNKLVNLVCSG